jgi:3'(2'), 5'-bisphosphate nucleotidase
LIELTRAKLEAVRIIAEEAGKEILKIYQLENFRIQTKSDNTPLTQADKASHNIILSALSKLAPEIPILSEEGEKFKLDANTYWCVDPLNFSLKSHLSLTLGLK